MSANLKREILRLLREDEEFRYAVAGYLGLEDIRSVLAQLVEAVRSLTEAVRALDQRVKSLESGLETAKADLSVLKTDVSTLKADTSSLKSDVATLKSDVAALKTDVFTLKSDVASLKTDVADLKPGYTTLRREIRSIRRTLENLTISEEEEANLVVTHLLRERGVNLETGHVVFDRRYEFDIYGTTGQLTVIGEAKVRAGPKAVERLVDRVETAKRKWPEKLPGKVVAVLYCLRAAPGTVQEAEKKGVWLIESMREKTQLQL
jgi:chromosome segregation ATPase